MDDLQRSPIRVASFAPRRNRLMSAPDPAMLEAIARQLMAGVGESYDSLTVKQRADEAEHVTRWIETCRAAGYALVPIAADGVVAALPELPTAAMVEALGIVPWVTGPIAHLYRDAGHTSPRKMEAEQAFVLFRLLRFAISHGAEWRRPAAEEQRALQRRSGASPT